MSFFPENLCDLRWGDLDGDDERRFCERCEKHVTNLSAMTCDAAASWVRANPGACVRLRHVDGAPVFAPVPGRQRKGVRQLLAAAVMIASPLAGCSSPPEAHASAPQFPPAATARAPSSRPDIRNEAAQQLRRAVLDGQLDANLAAARAAAPPDPFPIRKVNGELVIYVGADALGGLPKTMQGEFEGSFVEAYEHAAAESEDPGG